MVAAEHKTYEEAAAGIERTLTTTGLDCLGLMIIHSPRPWAEVNQSQDRHVEGNIAAYRALEDALEAGRLGMVALPKTKNPDRMHENAALGFEIAEEDMTLLNAAGGLPDYGESSFFPVYGGKL